MDAARNAARALLPGLLASTWLLYAVATTACTSVSQAAASAGSCALLPDEEIQAAIGPHHSGTSSLQYGPDSCRWVGTGTPPNAPGGWHDRIEIGVFAAGSPLQASFRRDATGEPVKDLGDGALYDRTEGQLWFPCGHDGFCVIEAATASGKNRQALAERLARIVRKRLK